MKTYHWSIPLALVLSATGFAAWRFMPNSQAARADGAAESAMEVKMPRVEPTASAALAGRRDSEETQGDPKVVAAETVYDFGVMDPGSKGEHVFVIRNDGGGPLRLTPGPSTCKCTIANLPTRQIAPGSEGQVVLSWKTTDKNGPFGHSATVWTNDPLQEGIVLKIYGKVRTVLGLEPAQLGFLTVHPGESQTDEAFVFSQGWKEFDITKVESSRAGLTCKLEPLSQERLDSREALSGYRLLISLPTDMPTGDFSDWIRFKAVRRDGDQEERDLQIGVSGEVLGGVTIYGDKIDMTQTLRMGVIDSVEGKTEYLTVAVREPPFDIKIVRTENTPEFLKTELTPIKVTKTVGLYRLTLTVPPGSPACGYMGVRKGEMILITDHPTKPKLRLRVAFSVLP